MKAFKVFAAAVSLTIVMLLTGGLVAVPGVGPWPAAASYVPEEAGGDPGWLDPELLGRISRAVDQIRIIDSHEHLVTEKLWLTHKVDFFYWFSHYSSSDLVSSGMSRRDLAFIRNPENSLDERWAKLAPWWPKVQFTGYGQALRLAARELYGIDEIDSTTWRELSRRITAAHKPGFYRDVIHDKAGIDLLILDSVRQDPYLATVMPDFFVRVECLDGFVGFERSEIPEYEQRYGVKIRGLGDLLICLDKAFDRIVAENFVGLKCRLAYRRTLKFDEVSRDDAEYCFRRIMSGDPSREEAKPFEDFMMHEIVRRAGERNLPVQIHTGLHEGNGNYITHSNPTHLANLFMDYPQTRFDLFHGSYPYMGELATLAKNFPNVYLDMCWLAIISPTTTRLWLHQWLETVPVNKILAFGGDYLFPSGTYAHSRIARRIVAETLTEKVMQGYMSEDEAIEVAKMILRENAIALFGLQKFLKK